MKRRKAIASILLAGVGGGIIFSGYKWFDWHKTPDLSALKARKPLVSALAETILPAGDTPGAAAAGVGDFIISMISDCTDRISANKFIDGLIELDHYTHSQYNRAYEACTAQEQTAILKHFEEKGRPFKGIIGKAQNKYLGRSFFTTLKEYTVKGYCTSQLGAQQGLAYLPIPGSYRGCIPLTPGQKAWATK